LPMVQAAWLFRLVPARSQLLERSKSEAS
jgi:hypothetical protein